MRFKRTRNSAPLPEICPADITGDGLVNITDLLALLSEWGPCPPPPSECPADINFDGVVNVSDLLELLSSWGPCE